MVFYLFIELNSNLNKSKLSSDYSNVNLSLHFFEFVHIIILFPTLQRDQCPSRTSIYPSPGS